MSQQTIDNSGTSDTLQSGIGKINDNFTEVYAAIIQTGMMVDYFGVTAPNGWVLATGGTIGNASSGATARANSDTQNLFILLWNAISNTYAAVSGGRGASAAADFAANKTITLPDLRGRVSAGLNGSTFTELGKTVGSEEIALSESNLAAHIHGVDVPYEFFNLFLNTGSANVQSGSDVEISTGYSNQSVNTDSIGSNTPFSVVQPSLTVNKIIKL